MLPLSDTDRNVPLGAIAHRAGGWKSAVGSRGKAPVGGLSPPGSRSSLQTSFRDFDSRDDRKLKISAQFTRFMTSPFHSGG